SHTISAPAANAMRSKAGRRRAARTAVSTAMAIVTAAHAASAPSPRAKKNGPRHLYRGDQDEQCTDDGQVSEAQRTQSGRARGIEGRRTGRGRHEEPPDPQPAPQVERTMKAADEICGSHSGWRENDGGRNENAHHRCKGT